MKKIKSNKNIETNHEHSTLATSEESISKIQHIVSGNVE